MARDPPLLQACVCDGMLFSTKILERSGVPEY